MCIFLNIKKYLWNIIGINNNNFYSYRYSISILILNYINNIYTWIQFQKIKVLNKLNKYAYNINFILMILKMSISIDNDIQPAC